MGHRSTTQTTTPRTASDRDAARGITTTPASRGAPGDVPPAWVSLGAGAVRVSLHERTIRRAISAGELTGYKFGKALRVRLDELDAWALSKAMPNPRTLRPVKAGGAR